MTEKFCLRWNDFESNVSKSFRNLRMEEDFYDVTLVSSDHRKLQAHKLVLSACSEYFKNILKLEKNTNTLLCLEAISSEEIVNILDYIYNGEVKIYQEGLDRFLQIAQRFQLQGLIGEESHSKKDDIKDQTVDFNNQIPSWDNAQSNIENNLVAEIPRRKVQLNTKVERSVIPLLDNEITTNLEELDNKILEYIEKDPAGFWKCTVCGKMDKKTTNIKEHVEIHVEGLTFPCKYCEKSFRSRNFLRNHNYQKHFDADSSYLLLLMILFYFFRNRKAIRNHEYAGCKVYKNLTTKHSVW